MCMLVKVIKPLTKISCATYALFNMIIDCSYYAVLICVFSFRLKTVHWASMEICVSVFATASTDSHVIQQLESVYNLVALMVGLDHHVINVGRYILQQYMLYLDYY